jgi:aminocarboxymuconate-semialdehyde decarboxylase
MTSPEERVGGVDVHAHWFGTDLAVPQRYDDPRWPRLVVDSSERGRILLGDRHFRDVRATLWDVDTRIADLDRSGIDVQVISPVPITFPYWADREGAGYYARAANASIAGAVDRSDGRLAGLGTLPLPHVVDAVAELTTLMTDSPLRGVEVGARIGDLELDDPRLLPFFEAAESLGAIVLVHPADGGGGSVRRGGPLYDFGLGMHTDTGLAATALVFGGVLERFPRLQVVLAHGCGSYAWSYPRLRRGAELFGGTAGGVRLDELTASLYVDSLVLDPEHLRLLEHRFGPERVLLGTDHPFFPDVTEGVRELLVGAETSGALGRGGAQRVFAANGRALLDQATASH